MERKSCLAEVREYWKNSHTAYLENVGTTFQAGYLVAGAGEPSAKDSNELLAGAAGVSPGDTLLDAGCGVCGPAIDIARHIDGVRITGVTISLEQAATATDLIRTAGLGTAISVTVADFHQLPFAGSLFDVVYFFESAGYSYDPRALFAEVWRVLRPGGAVYIKDVFRRDGIISERARRELSEFDRVFAFRTRAPGELCMAIADAGFADIRYRDIARDISTKHTLSATFLQGSRRMGLTAFGERHFRFFWELPVTFGEVKAIRPPTRAPA
jgi:ubiquinone/menaquinone biosynthesis C-methylase UbiE